MRDQGRSLLARQPEQRGHPVGEALQVQSAGLRLSKAWRVRDDEPVVLREAGDHWCPVDSPALDSPVQQEQGRSVPALEHRRSDAVDLDPPLLDGEAPQQPRPRIVLHGSPHPRP